MSDVLIDNPQSLVIHGEDERLAHLAKGFECRESSEIDLAVVVIGDRSRATIAIHGKLRSGDLAERGVVNARHGNGRISADIHCTVKA